MTETTNNFSQNNMLKKIGCKCIVMKIINDLKDIKLLEFIRYNKNYQKIMKKKYYLSNKIKIFMIIKIKF